MPILQLADRDLARELALPVDIQRPCGIILPRRAIAQSVEDIVGRQVHKRDAGGGAGRGNSLRSQRIDAVGRGGLRFRAVDRGVGRTVDGETAPADGVLHREGIGDVAFGAPQWLVRHPDVPRARNNGTSDLPLRTQDQQTGHPASIACCGAEGTAREPSLNSQVVRIPLRPAAPDSA